MILKLIDDMNNALNANCYFAALSIALMLPDICGKAEYPDQNTSSRYKKWYIEYVGKYEKCDFDNYNMPYLSANVVYNLRNSYLHSGNPNVDCNEINIFELVIEPKNKFNVYGDTAKIDQNGNKIYEVNVRRLCLIISSSTKGYYENNKEKFNFFNYSVRYDEGIDLNKVND